jgi:hypothetical protein
MKEYTEFSANIPAQLQHHVDLNHFRRFVKNWNNLKYPGTISKTPRLPTGDSELRAHPHSPPASAKKWCDRTRRRHRLLS